MKAYGLALLRVTVGAIYLIHASRLVFGGGVPDAAVALPIVIALQGLGGLLILAGVFTRPAAAATALIPALTLLRGVGRVPLGALELPALLMAATVALLFLGSGPVALRPSR